MAKERIYVQVGTPWPDGIDIQAEKELNEKEQTKFPVQVGKPWPDDIVVEVNDSVQEKNIKLSILIGFAILVALQQIAFTAYGVFVSENILEKSFKFSMYVSGTIVLWAVGPKISDKILEATKIIEKIITKK
ncbi:MAG: hypothetical protein ETSY1_47170 (plasmid) [Candidatus Entotheonella factor]|uniref:Uncharacterized protein n=1 Tax=Entotheonella factor TaxID=1429438 RepID=W4LZD7_ENTF1|nr:MAG: hypothetical protein ETSY1_47170 [Candidatus Entotheonella factor]